jgi:hypothetical protein
MGLIMKTIQWPTEFEIERCKAEKRRKSMVRRFIALALILAGTFIELSYWGML